MRNAIPLFLIALLIVPALFVGRARADKLEELRYTETEELSEDEYPNRGSVEVLNGCGVNGLAARCQDFLREHHFDVKSTGNVVVSGRSVRNYSETIVVSRQRNMEQAELIADLLGCGKPVFIRTDYNESDVTVILGHNYGDF